MSPRRYGRWAGNPAGTGERIRDCIKEIRNRPDFHKYQCSRKRGHGPDGLYCKQHGKMEEKRRERHG